MSLVESGNPNIDAQPKGMGWLDKLHMGLNAASIILDASIIGAPISFIPDVIDAIVSLGEGDFVGAGMSVLGAVPELGAASNAMKMARIAEKVAADAKKIEKAAGETTRIRHYTNSKGIEGIEESGVIRAADKNTVYAESAPGRPLSPSDAEDTYGLKPGRGRNYVETDVPTERVERRFNPATKTDELRIKGDVELSNPTFERRP